MKKIPKVVFSHNLIASLWKLARKSVLLLSFLTPTTAIEPTVIYVYHVHRCETAEQPNLPQESLVEVYL